MSIKAMMHVWWNSKSSANDRLVLLAIADEADDEGRNAFPSMRRLADKVNCHTETVNECIKRLEASGELEVKRPDKPGRGRFNRYRVVMEENPVKSVHSDPGSIYGSVEGSVRMDPYQNKAQSVPKQEQTRTKESTGARFPLPRQGCDECAGGWKLDDDDNAIACGCEDVQSA